MDRTVFWVIPAYNESASIADLLDRIAEVSHAENWRYHVIVVDDGSADATGDLSRQKAETGLPVEVLRNEPNQGLGFTMRRGLKAASDQSQIGDVIVTLDADLTQDPIYAVDLVAAIGKGSDVAIASRYRPGSGIEGVSFVRRMLSYTASGMVALVRPIRGVRDYSCGFRAYRATVISQGFERDGDHFVSERGFACQLEIAERLREHAAFVEVPFTLRYQDKRQASAIKIMPTIGAYFRVIAKVAGRRRRRVPIATLAVAFTSVVLGAFGQFMLRKGASGLAGEAFLQTISDALGSPQVIAGLGLYAVSSALWLVVLSRMEVAVAYPLGASGYVIVVALAALSGETIPPARWAGVALIVLGVVMVGWLGVAPVRSAEMLEGAPGGEVE